MPNSFSLVQIDYLKREAKQLHRSNPSVTHAQALDLIASKHGYSNWSLLAKHNETANSPNTLVVQLATGPTAFEFVRTSDEMRQALRKVRAPQHSYYMPAPNDLAETLVGNICKQFVSVENAVDYAIAYMTVLLSVPRYKIYSATKVYFEMRCWLPYSLQELSDGRQILVNRHYKPVGDTTNDWVDYEQAPHLHSHVDKQKLLAFTSRHASVGYLFNDGCPPWDSRQDADEYLVRLRILKAVLTSQ